MAAWLIALALNAALALVLRPSVASVPARVATRVDAGLTVRLADPPTLHLSRVEEAPLRVAAPVAGRADDPDGLLVQALGSLPVAGSSRLVNVDSGLVPGGDLLVPLGSSGSTSLRFDGDSSLTGGKLADGSWNGLIRSLRSRGLDIVIVFDATGSMGGEIDQVKRQINQIGTTLLKLIPKTRIGLVAYRDYGDAFVANGIPLTNDLALLQRDLAGVRAGGGGDSPEAVHEGLGWAITHNTFLPSAKKVILIFGDAPPHPEYLATCLALANAFHKEKGGVVSTVTCRSGTKIDEFVQIAKAGGGESFFTTDTRSLMEQLIVLVFGSRHRDKVLEAFRLLER